MLVVSLIMETATPQTDTPNDSGRDEQPERLTLTREQVIRFEPDRANPDIIRRLPVDPDAREDAVFSILDARGRMERGERPDPDDQYLAIEDLEPVPADTPTGDQGETTDSENRATRSTAEPEDGDYQRYLRRDGWTADEISAMERSIGADALRARAEAIRSRQAEGDRLGNEVAQLRRRIDPAARQGADPDDSDDPDAQVDVAEPDEPDDTRQTGDPLNDLLEALESETSPELADRFRSVLEPVLSERQRAQQDHLVQQLEPIRQQLAEEFPQIRDPGAYERVLQIADMLGGDPRYREGGIEALMRRAAVAEFGVETQTQIQRQALERSQHELNGQPDDPPSTRRPANALAEPDWEDRAFDMLQNGMTPAEIREARARAIRSGR